LLANLHSKRPCHFRPGHSSTEKEGSGVRVHRSNNWPPQMEANGQNVFDAFAIHGKHPKGNVPADPKIDPGANQCLLMMAFADDIRWPKKENLLSPKA
jgi:hypothetical protein